MKRALYSALSPQKITKERVFLTAEQIAGILNVNAIIETTHNISGGYCTTAFIFSAIGESPK